MCKVRVAIDTSILRGDGGLSSAAMEALARYAENEHVEILIPSIVAKEYTSKPSAKIEALEDLRKTTRSLKKTSPSELHQQIADLENSVGEAFDRHESAARERFEQWQKRTGATIVPISGDHATKAMDKYFAGALPFGSPKARTDIPDALIAEAILDLASEEPLFAVVADGRLSQALEASEDISVFKGVRDLLESGEFEEALSETGVRIEREKENAARASLEFLADNKRYLKALENDVSRLVSSKTIHYRNRWYDEKDGQDEIYIASVQDVYDWKFDGHDYLGEGVAVVDFEASVEIEADDSGGEWRDEDGNLDSSRTVTVSGAVSISLDLVDLARDPAKISGTELLRGASISIDELDDISLVARPH